MTIEDGVPPEIICPDTIFAQLSAETGASTKIVEYSPPVVKDNQPGVSVALARGSLASGSAFPLGSTIVTYRATDTSRLTAECSFYVIVGTSDTLPSLACPVDIKKTANDIHATVGGVKVEYPLPVSSKGSYPRLRQGLASGSVFPYGINTVTYSSGADTCSFTVWIYDDVPPTITCPVDIRMSLQKEGDTEVKVDYTLPAGQDNAGQVNVQLTNGFGPGSFFPLGETLIEFTATDKAGNKASCSAMVKIVEADGNNPGTTTTCPQNMTVPLADNPDKVVVQYPIITTLGGQLGTLSEGLASGAYFPIGVTRVTYQLPSLDDEESCTFFVTVVDATPPSIQCPETVRKVLDGETVQVTYTQPLVTDNRPGVTTSLLAGQASGALFTQGNHLITYGAVDSAGNQAECSFWVIVHRGGRPTLTCPTEPIVARITEPGATTIVVNYKPVVSSDGTTPSLSAGLPSGSEFPKGDTNVTYTIFSSVCTFTVRVKDAVPPTITCPSDITKVASGNVASVFFPTARAKDNFPGVIVRQSRGSATGSYFAVGVSRLEFTATDAAGNTATCNFTITVIDGSNGGGITLNCPDDIVERVPKGTMSSMVTYADVTASDGSIPYIVTGLSSGNTFPLGTTKIIYSTGSQSCSFNVTVTSEFSPEFTSCPFSFTKHAKPGSTDLAVQYAIPTAMDARGGQEVVVVLNKGIVAGSWFPVGVTHIEYKAIDVRTQMTTLCGFDITVVQSAGPTILQCPPSIFKKVDTSVKMTTVTYQTPVASDDSLPEIIDGFGSGYVHTLLVDFFDLYQSLHVRAWPIFPHNLLTLLINLWHVGSASFPRGLTLVRYRTATGATCDFTVAVHAGELLLCPSDARGMLESTSQVSTPVFYPSPLRVDSANQTDMILTRVCQHSKISTPLPLFFFWFILPSLLSFASPYTLAASSMQGKASGSDFPKGATEVSYNAVDPNGQVIATCSFTVTVSMVRNCPADIIRDDVESTKGERVEYTTPRGPEGSRSELRTGPSSGQMFDLGSTEVSWVIFDQNNAIIATCSFNVTVNTEHWLQCPEDIEETNAGDLGPSGKFIQYALPQTLDRPESVIVTRTSGLNSGNNFLCVACCNLLHA